MADKRFFKNFGPFSVRELAEACNGQLSGCDPSLMINDVASLENAGSGDISFMYSMKYKRQLQDTKAAVCVIPAEGLESAPQNLGLIISRDAKRAAAAIIEKFYPPHHFTPGIDAEASVADSAAVGEGCRIDAGAIIKAGVKIGCNTWVKSGAFIGENVEIGSKCVIGVNASLTHCILGDDVVTYAGVRIGEDGFGFALGPQGHKKVPQIGLVIIGNDIEIGANTCIDRGAFENTVIGDGCRIDNLVQIGHNVKIGKGCYIVSQAGIAGSCVIEDFVVIGGQVGIADNLTVGKGSMIAGQSGLSSNLAPGSKVMGNPAVPVREFFKQAVLLQNMVRSNKGKGVKNK